RADFMSGVGVAKERGGGDRFTILVFGGSQGARAINRAFLGALPHLCAEGLSMKIIHQTGQDDLTYVTGVYGTYEIEVEVLPFIRDMAAAYRTADLVICRAGATSLAEITVLGKAAVLIPFPFAVDDHQTKNAIEMVRAGAAVMIEEKKLTGEEMAETINLFYHRRELLRDMEIKSAALGNIRAAADIVDHCVALL
ncbi:MAG: glycosyltransferase, partial [Deltaproteobacteria bacterium]|nr:glycosyltransferase [Deltaproteobacteria bacterium]